MTTSTVVKAPVELNTAEAQAVSAPKNKAKDFLGRAVETLKTSKNLRIAAATAVAGAVIYYAGPHVVAAVKAQADKAVGYISNKLSELFAKEKPVHYQTEIIRSDADKKAQTLGASSPFQKIVDKDKGKVFIAKGCFASLHLSNFPDPKKEQAYLKGQDKFICLNWNGQSEQIVEEAKASSLDFLAFEEQCKENLLFPPQPKTSTT